jgi:hypothetical protein
MSAQNFPVWSHYTARATMAREREGLFMDPEDDNPENGGGELPLKPSLRLEAVPYRPEGGCSAVGTFLIFALVWAGSLGIGYGASWVHQWFYIILLFPLLIGVVLGFVGAIGVNLGKLRNPFLAVLAGLFGGCLTMVSMHYFDYERFLEKFREKLKDAQQLKVKNLPGGVPPAPRVVPALSFSQYIGLKARQGVPVHFRRIHFNLGQVGSYIYWAVEILIVSLLAMLIMYWAASEPFCGACHSWKGKRVLGKLDLAPETAERIFTRGEIVRLADLGFPKGEGQIHLTAWVCTRCQAEAPVDVKLDQVTKNAKDEEVTKQLAFLTFPGPAWPVLESLFTEPVPEAAVEANEDPGTQES